MGTNINQLHLKIAYNIIGVGPLLLKFDFHWINRPERGIVVFCDTFWL